MECCKGKAVLFLLAGTLALGLVALAWAIDAGSSQAQQGTMHNCPQAGKWAISVWEGDDATDTGQALARCSTGAVDFAYYLDPATNNWQAYFEGQPLISKLLTLDNMQGVLAHGAVGAPVATATPIAQASPTPTPTPAATATPTPEATPSPTAPMGAAGDVILVSSNAFTTTSSMLLDGESRRLHIVGELRNDSSTLRSAGKIKITIYDAAGNVVGRRSDYAFDDVIRPGRTTAFDEEVPSMLYWSDETGGYPQGWATYDITLSPRDPYSTEGPPLDVTVHDVQVSIGEYDWLYIRGTVRNDDSRPQKWSGDVYAILYDQEDKILNASIDSFDELQPGQSTEFEIKFYDDEPIGYSRYLVQAYAEAE
jgi:hypothetical protein